MISIYNGRRRALGNEETKDVHLQISVKMRKHLHHFKGARLGVFIAIALHVDERGWAWPPFTLIKKESAYQSDDTVYRALADLCGGVVKGQRVRALTIKGHRVLLRTKTAPPHAPAGLQDGKRNFYLFFPTPEEVEAYEEKEDSVLKHTSDFYDPTFQDTENYDPTFQDTENQGAEVIPGSKAEPGRKEEPHTHEAEPGAAAPPQSPPAPLLALLAERESVCVSQSKYSAAERSAYADRYGLGPGWLHLSADGRYDATIDACKLKEQIAQRRPEQIVAERAAPPHTRLFYPEACQIVVALTQAHGSDPAKVIAELDVSDEVRAQLRAKFVAKETTADANL